MTKFPKFSQRLTLRGRENVRKSFWVNLEFAFTYIGVAGYVLPVTHTPTWVFNSTLFKSRCPSEPPRTLNSFVKKII